MLGSVLLLCRSFYDVAITSMAYLGNGAGTGPVVSNRQKMFTTTRNALGILESFYFVGRLLFFCRPKKSPKMFPCLKISKPNVNVLFNLIYSYTG